MTEALHIRLATLQDARLLWEWVNDPDVRAASFVSAPISWEDHVAWLTSKCADPSCRLYLLSLMDVPHGQVRFDLQPDGLAEIDLSVAPTARGHGLGTQMVRVACREFFALHKSTWVKALIKPDNEASIKTFLRAGFTRRGQAYRQGILAYCFILHPLLADAPLDVPLRQATVGFTDRWIHRTEAR